MELCDGGSLLSVLDEPANAYGLDDKEFLVFLKDIGQSFQELQYTTVHYSTIHYSTLHHTTVHFSSLQYTTYTVLYTTLSIQQ